MSTAHKCAIKSKASTHSAECTVICECRSNLSSLSSATFWSNGSSTDVNDMSSKLLHGLSQMDADTLTSLSSGQCPDSCAGMPCLETMELHLILHPCQCIGQQLHVTQYTAWRTHDLHKPAAALLLRGQADVCFLSSPLLAAMEGSHIGGNLWRQSQCRLNLFVHTTTY